MNYIIKIKGDKTMNNETMKSVKRIFSSVKNYLEFDEEWDRVRNSIRNYSPNNPKIIFYDRERSEENE